MDTCPAKSLSVVAFAETCLQQALLIKQNERIDGLPSQIISDGGPPPIFLPFIAERLYTCYGRRFDTCTIASFAIDAFVAGVLLKQMKKLQDLWRCWIVHENDDLSTLFRK